MEQTVLAFQLTKAISDMASLFLEIRRWQCDQSNIKNKFNSRPPGCLGGVWIF